MLDLRCITHIDKDNSTLLSMINMRRNTIGIS